MKFQVHCKKPLKQLTRTQLPPISSQITACDTVVDQQKQCIAIVEGCFTPSVSWNFIKLETYSTSHNHVLSNQVNAAIHQGPVMIIQCEQILVNDYSPYTAASDLI